MKLHKRTLLPRRKRKGKENKAKVEIDGRGAVILKRFCHRNVEAT